VSDRALAYDVNGPADAPVLVLSSSLGTSRDMWDPQMPRLTREWRVVRIDHPGHGESPVWNGPITIGDIGQAVLGVVDEAGHDRVSFCGLSLGSAIGQWVAAHAPERVERLILCSTSAHFGPEPYLSRAATVRREGLAEVAAATMERWFTAAFRASEPETVSRYRAMVAATPVEGYASCCEAVGHFDGRPDLQHISAPTLVLSGAEDPATPPEAGSALAHGIAGARQEILQDAAHLLNVERPDETTRAIVRHLRGEDHD
jgi:3-oxoadipate enol-lactonase